MASAAATYAKAPFAPVASKVRYVEAKFTNDRGKSMFYCAFFPKHHDSLSPPEPLRGIVLFLHGIGEHSHRFTHVYEYLCAHNYGVIAYDMAAHGRSECERNDVRGHSDEFQHFVDDTNRFVTVAKQQIFPQMLPKTQSPETVPLLFMGISFGTLVGLHTVLSGVHKFSAIVLASPAVSVEFTLVLRVLSVFSKSLSWLTPTAKIVPGVNFDGTCAVHYESILLVRWCCADNVFLTNVTAVVSRPVSRPGVPGGLPGGPTERNRQPLGTHGRADAHGHGAARE